MFDSFVAYQSSVDETIVVELHDELLMKSGAVFSPCRTYRYVLWREWDDSKPTLVFFMLNPSTADHRQLDNTVKGCLKRAVAWGYGRLVVLNLFALRSTDPKGLALVDDPVGPENDRLIADVLTFVDRQAGLVICGWGDDVAVGDRGRAVLASMEAQEIVAYALALNQNGSPKHPLYVAHAVRPRPMPSVASMALPRSMKRRRALT